MQVIASTHTVPHGYGDLFLVVNTKMGVGWRLDRLLTTLEINVLGHSFRLNVLSSISVAVDVAFHNFEVNKIITS